MKFILFTLLICSINALTCKNGLMPFGEECVDGNTILDFCEEFHSDKFGCKRCIKDYTPTLHGICVKCTHMFANDCIDCNQTYTQSCNKCREGAIMTREGACIYCHKYFRNCKQCDGQKMRCTLCSNGKKPQNGFC